MSLNLAPLVDVMMCLIIFFLLASALVDVQAAAVNLPEAAAAEQIPEGEMRNRVVITVRPDQAGGAEYLVRQWDGRKITESRLNPADLETLLTEHAQRASRLGQKPRCVVRADEALRYDAVEIVLRACGLAQVPEVVFYAEPLEAD